MWLNIILQIHNTFEVYSSHKYKEKNMTYILPIFPLPWWSRGSIQTGLSGWACGTCLSWFTWLTLKQMLQ